MFASRQKLVRWSIALSILLNLQQSALAASSELGDILPFAQPEDNLTSSWLRTSSLKTNTATAATAALPVAATAVQVDQQHQQQLNGSASSQMGQSSQEANGKRQSTGHHQAKNKLEQLHNDNQQLVASSANNHHGTRVTYQSVPLNLADLMMASPSMPTGRRRLDLGDNDIRYLQASPTALLSASGENLALVDDQSQAAGPSNQLGLMNPETLIAAGALNRAYNRKPTMNMNSRKNMGALDAFNGIVDNGPRPQMGDERHPSPQLLARLANDNYNRAALASAMRHQQSLVDQAAGSGRGGGGASTRRSSQGSGRQQASMKLMMKRHQESQTRRAKASGAGGRNQRGQSGRGEEEEEESEQDANDEYDELSSRSDSAARKAAFKEDEDEDGGGGSASSNANRRASNTDEEDFFNERDEGDSERRSSSSSSANDDEFSSLDSAGEGDGDGDEQARQEVGAGQLGRAATRQVAAGRRVMRGQKQAAARQDANLGANLHRRSMGAANHGGEGGGGSRLRKSKRRQQTDESDEIESMNSRQHLVSQTIGSNDLEYNRQAGALNAGQWRQQQPLDYIGGGGGGSNLAQFDDIERQQARNSLQTTRAADDSDLSASHIRNSATDLQAAAGHHHHGHGHYYQFVEVPKKKAWKFGFKRGNHKHEIMKKEKGYKNKFHTEFKWHAKEKCKKKSKCESVGKMTWDYKHHDKKHHGP